LRLKHEIENFRDVGSTPTLSDMLVKESVLTIADNSGARNAKCIGILATKGVAKIGRLIKIVLRKLFNTKKKVKKKLMYIGIIVGLSYWIARLSGYFLKFYTNRVIVLGPSLKFLGTRVYGPVSREFRYVVHRYKGARFYYKLLSYSCIIV
jgi:large subunit ribosomal protein L14